jgi:molecular chaperone GrpE
MAALKEVSMSQPPHIASDLPAGMDLSGHDLLPSVPAESAAPVPGGLPLGLDDALAEALAAIEAMDRPKSVAAPASPVIRGVPAISSTELHKALTDELEANRLQMDGMRKTLAGTQRELATAREDLLVARKRTQRAEQEGPFQGARKTLETLLPLFDNLYAVAGHLIHNERLSGHGQQAVEMLTAEMARCLQRLEVEPFDAVGQMFDPSDHELISHFRESDQPEGVVLRQAGRGYRLQGRLLRGARVIVNRR